MARCPNTRHWVPPTRAAHALPLPAPPPVPPAAGVSRDAQYGIVYRARHGPAIAALEAGIPDTGALIFAALGIALALHGRRALRPRTLNVACVGLSLTMNAIAASPGWRDAAIWVMP